MNVIYSVKDYVSNVFHGDAGSGAIDVLAVQQDDGALQCSPFHVHFGAGSRRQPQDKTQITVEVNGQAVDVRMKLGAAGEAYFVQQVQEPVEEKDYAASPLPSPISGEEPTPFSIGEQAGQPEDEEDAEQMHDEASDRMTWGWGALPVVRLGTEEEDDLPEMTKSASVYFDAVDIEATSAAEIDADNARFDHPSMSLCGDLLEEGQPEAEVYHLFSEHTVTFEFFRENAAAILTDPRLRFFVDGKLEPYNVDMQAYLVSRVLFPYSQRLPVEKPPIDNVMGKSASEATILKKLAVEESEPDVSYSKSTRPGYKRVPLALTPLDEVASDDGNSTQDTASLTGEIYYKKSLLPSQEDLLKMQLRVGTNDISFVMRAQGGEMARVSAKLYLWPVTAKVVIAQIDGAISSSAATGSMFKRKDPSAMHPGALEFYSRLARNGYRIVYVTCYGLSQANLLQALLHNGAGEDGNISLPMGPVLLSPDRLLSTYGNEIVDAQDFKVAALDALRALFPCEVNPFYAAFGTTQADSIVFTQVGVFQGKVFLVNPIDGSVRHRSLAGFHESYSSLMTRMDSIFPPIYSLMSKPPLSAQSSTILATTPPQSSSSTTSQSFNADNEQLVSEAVASQVRTRSLADEAYNDINFWRIEPGLID